MQEADFKAKLNGLHESKPQAVVRKGRHRHFPSSDLVNEINFLNKLRSKWPSPSKTTLNRKSSAKNIQEIPEIQENSPEETQFRPQHKKASSHSSANMFLYAEEADQKAGMGKGLVDKTARRGSHKRTYSGVKSNSMKFSGILGLQFLQKSNNSQRMASQHIVSAGPGPVFRPNKRLTDVPVPVTGVAQLSSSGLPFKNSRLFKRETVQVETKTNNANKESSAKMGKGVLANFGSEFLRKLKDIKSTNLVKSKVFSKPPSETRQLAKKQSKPRIFQKMAPHFQPPQLRCFRKNAREPGLGNPASGVSKSGHPAIGKLHSAALYREISRPLQLPTSKNQFKEPTVTQPTEINSSSAKKQSSKEGVITFEFKKKQPIIEPKESEGPENPGDSSACNLQVSELYQPTDTPSEPASAQKSVVHLTEVKSPHPVVSKGRHIKNVHSLPQNNLNEIVRRLRIPINFLSKAKHCSMTPDASIQASPRETEGEDDFVVNINEESKESPSGGSSVGRRTPLAPATSPEMLITGVSPSPLRLASLQVSPRCPQRPDSRPSQFHHNIAIAEPEAESQANSVRESTKKQPKNPNIFKLSSHPVSLSSPVNVPSNSGHSRQSTPQNPISPGQFSQVSHQQHFVSDRPDLISTREDLNRKVLIDKIRGYRSLTGKVMETTLEFYTLSRMIGEGSYGKVYLGHSVLSGKPVAMKCYDKSKIRAKSTTDRILQEVDILSNLDHDGIIRMFEIFENKKFIFMVLEFVDCGDLLTWMRDHGKFSEASFLPVLHQILEALAYMHSQSILHRDVKLDNILLGSDGRIRICDFGISKKMPAKGLIFEHIGTPAYIAPEIVVEKGYSGFKADVWSLGITCFIAMTGHIPFKGNDISQLQNNILSNDLQFPRDCKLSDQMKSVIGGMLEKNPRRRSGIAEVAAALGLPLNVPSELRQRTLDKQKIEMVKALGFDESLLISGLRNNEVNHGTALYKMI